MKLSSTLKLTRLLTATILFLTMGLYSTNTFAQISLVCTSPNSIIYGLANTGEIREINTTNATNGAAIKNTTYTSSSAKNANGLGYNPFNGNFYYFKRNITETTPQFVTFNPKTGIVTTLASCPAEDDIHTGCASFNGQGYYTIDVTGTLYYYNIAANTWKKITNVFIDQNGADVDAVIRNQNAGDMAIDGYGNIFIVTANSDNYALYRISAPAPTNTVASLKVYRIIAPTTPTPNGQSFAGIAFNPSGQIFMSTKDGNRLYRLNNNLTLTSIGTMSTTDIGNDLTSCNFPNMILPIAWKSFDISLQHDNIVKLNWEVGEANNKGFYVQHSLDGSSWQDVSYIVSKATVDAYMQTYSYTHVNNFSGTQYYRIRQVDIDGSETYSDTKTIVIKTNKASIAVWPNPATDQIRIVNQTSDKQSIAKAQIFDLSGKPVITKQLQYAAITTINVSSLPADTYIVRVENSDGTSFKQKINKQ